MFGSRMVLIVFAIFFAGAVCQRTPAIPHLGLKKNTPSVTTSSFDDYLQRAREMNTAAAASSGSLWVASGPLAVMAQDYRAHNAGDLVFIVLNDSFSATTAGENKQSRQFSGSSSITGLVGKIGVNNALQNLFNANSAHSLDGKGQSTMSSNLQLNVAAQIQEVLPNGVLVIKAARDFTVGNDRQTVVLHGLVREGDLASNNTIPSTSVSNLELEIKGKGAVADASRQPNVVIRTLLRLFSF